ncbi:MAG: deoxyribose-phosphate aldolase [Peptococcaceae bacterium]|nr:deoxyribose-phosphate aldolase [Peptococcaceae bacterium]
MTNAEILAAVDHTQLNPAATWSQIRQLCREALEYRTASVCIPPAYVARVRKEFPKLNICTVIGFPLGYHTTEVKVFETKEALRQGADEVDLVVNLTDVKNGDFGKVSGEIRVVKEACGRRVLKVIVEACYLTEQEKIQLCRCVNEGGADYIKTSTGFGSGGAVLTDVELFKRYIGPGVKIKAAGGIRTKKQLTDFLQAGCARLGSSSAVKLLQDEEAGEN